VNHHLEDLVSRARLRSQPNQTGIPDDALDRMERSFHADFSNVRVSETSAARELGAIAFAQGSDIQFAPGEFDPCTTEGLEVLGHELAHVLQQHEGRAAGVQAKSLPLLLDDGHEHEADVLGARAARGEAVVTPEGSVRRPARTRGSVIQAMFRDGVLYRVRNKVSGLKVGDLVIMKSTSTVDYTVVRKADDQEFKVPNAQAIKANFQELKLSPKSTHYVPQLPNPARSYGLSVPTSDEPAELVTKGRGKRRRETFDSAFSRVDLRKIDFSKLPFTQEIFGSQASIDRAALSLAVEAMNNGTGFVDTVIDELTGKERQQLFVADVWSGRFNAYEESDKDHLMNQREIMDQLAAIERYAQRGEAEELQVRALFRRMGARPAKKQRDFRVTQGTVDLQYGNPDNLGFAGKALNQRAKSDQPVWDTLDSSLLHNNLASSYDRKSMVGKAGQVLGREIKENLRQGANQHYLEQNRRIRRMDNRASGQATRSRRSRKRADELRGVNDTKADRHEARAGARSRKLALECDAFETIAKEVQSEDEDGGHLEQMEKHLGPNLRRMFRGIREGKEVDIESLQKGLERKRQALAEKKQELDVAGEAVDDVERRARVAEARVAELERENQDLKNELKKLTKKPNRRKPRRGR
jgi:hypothetical protein